MGGFIEILSDVASREETFFSENRGVGFEAHGKENRVQESQMNSFLNNVILYMI